MNKKILIFIALVVVGLGIGTAIGLNQIKQTQLASADESKTVEQKILTRTDAERQVAIDKIKSLFGKDLTITYKESETKYYSYGIPDPATITDFTQFKTIETYTDNMGFTIKVDVANNEILSKTKDCAEDGHAVTDSEAKMIAQGLLAKLTNDDPDNYTLIENKNQNIYNSVWQKTHEGNFYNMIPSQKEQTLAKREERTIAICMRNGELMSYEYKPALTEQELTQMSEQWNNTQSSDIKTLRKFLNSPDKQFTFVNYMTCSQCGPNETENSFRVYKDEDGYCYDLDKNGNVTPDTEMYGKCKTPDRIISNNDAPPSGAELARAEQAIKTFMGDQNLELQYITQSKDRPIYIFQQKEYINDRCEVYEYQVAKKTNQIIEIGIVYPEEMQQGNPTEMQEKRSQCLNYGSLEVPLKAKDEIEKTAFAYLGRDPEHTKLTLRSDIRPEYISSKPGAAKPAMNEWKWEDVRQNLLIRIVISSGGKLIYYFNTTGL